MDVNNRANTISNLFQDHGLPCHSDCRWSPVRPEALPPSLQCGGKHLYHCATCTDLRNEQAPATRARRDQDRLAGRPSAAQICFVVVPVTNPQLRERSIQVQTMAGRDLPASVRAFRDHLIDAMKAASVPPNAARGSRRPRVR